MDVSLTSSDLSIKSSFMDKIYEQEYHLLEENYWWFEARRHFIIKLVKKLKLERNSKILEIGCSGGPLIKELNNLGFNNVHGIDISPEAISRCTKRGLRNVQIMDAAATNFKDGEFDLIISSDILEHIKDEEKALGEWERILAPYGNLLVFVPAFEFLWSHHDDVNLHYRRYTRKKLVSSIEPLKLKILKSSYWNFTLF